MNPEQFVFWLDGYLSGMVHDESVTSLYAILDTQLKTIIKTSRNQEIQGILPYETR